MFFKNKGEQKKTFGEKLVANRHIYGLPQKELAHSLGIDPTTLGHWERDENRPMKKSLEKFTALFSFFPYPLPDTEIVK